LPWMQSLSFHAVQYIAPRCAVAYCRYSNADSTESIRVSAMRLRAFRRPYQMPHSEPACCRAIGRSSVPSSGRCSRDFPEPCRHTHDHPTFAPPSACSRAAYRGAVANSRTVSSAMNDDGTQQISGGPAKGRVPAVAGMKQPSLGPPSNGRDAP
jgi:hypothetical protein